MTYKLNVCLFSPIFEKSFGLTSFAKDYEALIAQIDNSEYMQCFRSDIINKKLYKLFCKLSHFFDDFNFFINESVRTRTEHDSKQSVDRRLHDFIRRVESMKIPRQIQDTIAGFLKMQRAKAALVATRENSWLIPAILPKGDLNILHGKPKNTTLKNFLLAKKSATSFENAKQHRAQILQSLYYTWQKYPELRLGQLISNSLPEGTDIFYVTDDKLIELLKNFEANNGFR
jgi:hypothetical protein